MELTVTHTRDEQKRLDVLKAEMDTIRAAAFQRAKDFFEKKISEGWQVFRFHSECTREEWGDQDELFLFAPTVDVEQWRGVHFEHGRTGNKAHEAFEGWLDSVPEKSVFEVDEFEFEELCEQELAKMAK